MPSKTASPKTDTGANPLSERVPKEISVVTAESITAKAVESVLFLASLKNSA
jgi:hypothetical protein